MTTSTTRAAGSPDQRRHRRARVHFPARYVSSNLNLEGRVTDVSPDGLFFCSDFLDHQGETARISIQVPTRARPLELRGEVRWVSDSPDAGGMGVKLIDVSLEDRALLESMAPGVAGTPRPLPSGNA